MSIHKKLADIQQAIKAGKNKRNDFGKFQYRNLDGILQALKPLLGDMVLTFTDDVTEVGGRVFLKTSAILTDGKESIVTSAMAEIPLTKKGMSAEQVTGSASSYARKYCACGLLLIDDSTQDPDGMDNSKPEFEYDDIAKQWVAACKADINNLEQLTGAYKLFIKGNL